MGCVNDSWDIPGSFSLDEWRSLSFSDFAPPYVSLCGSAVNLIPYMESCSLPMILFLQPFCLHLVNSETVITTMSAWEIRSWFNFYTLSCCWSLSCVHFSVIIMSSCWPLPDFSFFFPSWKKRLWLVWTLWGASIKCLGFPFTACCLRDPRRAWGSLISGTLLSR